MKTNEPPSYFAVPLGSDRIRVCENRRPGYTVLCEVDRSPDLLEQLCKRGIPRFHARTIIYDLERSGYSGHQ